MHLTLLGFCVRASYTWKTDSRQVTMNLFMGMSRRSKATPQTPFLTFVSHRNCQQQIGRCRAASTDVAQSHYVCQPGTDQPPVALVASCHFHSIQPKHAHAFRRMLLVFQLLLAWAACTVSYAHTPCLRAGQTALHHHCRSQPGHNGHHRCGSRQMPHTSSP